MNVSIKELYDSIDSVSVSEAYICEPEKCLSFIKQNKKQLIITSENIRSISKNFDEFLILMKRTDTQPDVLVFTECWLSKCANLPYLDGYEVTSTSNNTLQNDGVVVFTKTSLKANTIEPSFSNANCLVTTINNNTVLISIYRSPSYRNTDNFITSLGSVLSNMTNFANIILLGDININILDSTSLRNSADYIDLLAYHGLLPAHNHPTRNNSCLDHVFIKTKQSALTLVVQNSLTDHHTLLLALQNYTNKEVTHSTITKVDYEAIKTQISTTDFSSILSATDCDTATNILVNTLNSIITKNTTSLKLSRRKTPLKPWMTPGLMRCLRHRDNLHSKSRKMPENETLQTIYKRYRNYCNKLFRKLKKAYEKSQFEKAGNLESY